MKLSSFWAGLFVLFLVVVPSAAAGDELAEWTVMVFLNADNDLEEYGIHDFYEMSDVGSTAEVNIIVQIDRSNGWFVWPAGADWHQTLRFHIKRDMAPVPASAIEDLGEVNMGSGAALADFVKWARAKFPAKRYFLDIWDHGQGWRLRRVLPLDPRAERYGDLLRYRIALLEAEMAVEDIRFLSANDPPRPILSPNTTVAGSVRYISIDDTDGGDKLFNREIQDSLEALLDGDRLDVIGFDACVMAMVETAYAMRNIATVMVGSEELEPGTGWDYRKWLGPLIQQPTMDAESLGRLLVSAYDQTYSTDDGDTTQSAVRLSMIEDLAKGLSELSNLLGSKLATEASSVLAARQDCKTYAPGYGFHGIDLGRFLERLAERSTNDQIQRAAQGVLSTLSASVIANYVGYGRGNDRGYGSKGLSLYFPESRFLFAQDPDSSGYLENNTEGPVQFVQKHTWDNFLQSFFAVYP